MKERAKNLIWINPNRNWFQWLQEITSVEGDSVKLRTVSSKVWYAHGQCRLKIGRKSRLKYKKVFEVKAWHTSCMACIQMTLVLSTKKKSYSRLNDSFYCKYWKNSKKILEDICDVHKCLLCCKYYLCMHDVLKIQLMCSQNSMPNLFTSIECDRPFYKHPSSKKCWVYTKTMLVQFCRFWNLHQLAFYGAISYRSLITIQLS